MAKQFTIINRLSSYHGHILEYAAPMMEGSKVLGVILKTGEGSSKPFYYHEVEETTTMPKNSPSAYEQWDTKGTDFGGFATSLFKTYRIADNRNRRTLQTAFSDYFQ